MAAQTYTPVTTSPLAGTATKIAPARSVVGPVVVANLTGAVAWLQLFDAALATDVTPGTTKPKATIAVGPNTAVGASTQADLQGLMFELGVVAASTTAAEGGTGANTNTMIGIG